MTGALLASLGMYDFPWTAGANDAFWAALAARLRAAGINAPLTLAREIELERIWQSPELIFGQTCGYPYVAKLRAKVALIAAPIYAFPCCEGAAHCSILVAPKKNAGRSLGDFRGSRAAINGRDSNSGMNLFRAAIAPIAGGRPFFQGVIETGSHEASLAMVSDGRADIAAIDCVSFGLLRQGRPALAESVAPIAQSAFSPTLPFIMNAALAQTHLGAVREALFATLEDPALASCRKTLGLVGAKLVGDEDYERVLDLERGASALGYPALA